MLSIPDRAALTYSPVTGFDDLPIPFRCVATDLGTGTAYVFKDGSLSEALRRRCPFLLSSRRLSPRIARFLSMGFDEQPAGGCGESNEGRYRDCYLSGRFHGRPPVRIFDSPGGALLLRRSRNTLERRFDHRSSRPSSSCAYRSVH